jgi:hypothetical protein
LIAYQYLEAQNILTLNGYVSESELKAGDKVIGYDNSRVTINTVLEKRLMTREFYSYQSLGFDFYIINDKYKFFSGQSIYANGNVIHVSELKNGDVIYDEHNKKIPVVKIRRRQNEYKWFRFIISGNHSYIKDGILVHNASRFWVGGGSSQNWNATSNTNWSATSGGSNNATVPGSSDDVTFNGAGGSGNTNSTISATITILSLNITSGYTATMTHNAVVTVAGNVTLGANYTIAGSSGLTISASGTITSNGKTWPNAMTFSGASATKTISGDLTIGGSLTISTNVQVINKSSTEKITCNGFISNVSSSGTIDIVLTGGTLSSGAAVSINSITFNGTITVANFNISGGSLIYNSGTVTHTGGLSLSGSMTFNTNGITWNTINCINAGQIVTINSLLSATTLTIGATTGITFAGSSGFTAGTFSTTQIANQLVTLQHGVTYTVTSAFNFSASRVGSINAFTSDDASIKAILTLNKGATCNVLANFTRIDASNGRTINAYNGTVTSCLNINSYTDLKTISRTFVQ